MPEKRREARWSDGVYRGRSRSYKRHSRASVYSQRTADAKRLSHKRSEIARYQSCGYAVAISQLSGRGHNGVRACWRWHCNKACRCGGRGRDDAHVDCGNREVVSVVMSRGSRTAERRRHLASVARDDSRPTYRMCSTQARQSHACTLSVQAWVETIPETKRFTYSKKLGTHRAQYTEIADKKSADQSLDYPQKAVLRFL